MNKLISRNPVQRFKQGKKIVKAQKGLDFPYKGNKIKLGLNAPSLNYTIPEINFPTDKIESLPSYSPMSYPYKGKKIQIGLDTNINLSPEKSLQKKKGRKLIERDGTEYWLGSDGSKTLLKKGKNSVINQKKTPINWNQNYNNFKNGLTTSQKAWLTNEGVDYNNVESVQNYLLGKLGNNALGKWGVDKRWGSASQAAWNKFASQTDFTPKVNINPEQIEKDRQTIINQTLPQPKLPTIPEGGISNFTPLSQTYNRAGVRDFLRNKGVNPYSFTGDQRRALRMVMNGQGTDEDKALVQSMGIFKKGGVLPSRNPITRFRNRKSN